MDRKFCDECTGNCKHGARAEDCCPECEEFGVPRKAPDHETFERMARGDKDAFREFYDFACYLDPDFPNKVTFEEFINTTKLMLAE